MGPACDGYCIPERQGIAWSFWPSWNVKNGSFPDSSAGFLSTMSGGCGTGPSKHKGRTGNVGFQSKRKTHQKCLRNLANAEFL